VLHRVLHLDDTPHRIAFGVFLGFVVGATPTLGLQMLIYVAIAALLGANKLSGILPVWISNPLTAVPLYYGNWWVGRLLLTGSVDGAAAGGDALEAAAAGGPTSFAQVDSWRDAVDAVFALGAELWVGSLVVGVVSGAVAYWITYRSVVAYRARRAGAAGGA
jgi:hypothetical protein